MSEYKIANVVLEDTPLALNCPALYCRATAPFYYDREESCWRLNGPGTFDFTTFFNAASIIKWRMYTCVEDLTLHLELCGGACRVFITWADELTRGLNPMVNSEPIATVEADDTWTSLDLDLNVPDKAVLIGFIIECDGSVLIRNSAYYADVDEESIRPIELAAAITTFKKEDFVINNIDLMKREIIESNEPIAQHFHLYVIDNGKTLDAEALSSERVTVCPNNNVGGTGGFAYGMILAMDQVPQATNVLLMDDDIAISPESIKRTYTLLALANDDYKDAFISGAMLSYETVDDFWEDLGFMAKEGHCAKVKPPMRMSVLQDIVYSETFVPKKKISKVTYAAWWYCCIPISTIKEEGLPLPVFVRCDDAEYGIRCHPRFITMDGICVWHMPFHSRYSAAVERYQMTRNTLIAQMTTGMAPKADFLAEMHNAIRLELKKYNYNNAELVLDGFEDFLKGPSFIAQPVAQECYMRALKKAEKLYSFDELQEQLNLEGIDLDLDELTILDIDEDLPRTRGEALVDYATCNGQRGPQMGNSQARYAIIPADGWNYMPGKMRNRDTLIVIDDYNRKGAIRHKDRDRFNTIQRRYKQDLNYYYAHKQELADAYHEAKDFITSIDYWRDYLGLDKTEATDESSV